MLFRSSKNPNLKNKPFTVFEFLNETMQDSGDMGYFAYWDGFNFPGNVLLDWMKMTPPDGITIYERKLLDAVFDMVDKETKFYVIGTPEGDIKTLNHEISHALYYLNQDFKKEMTEILTDYNKNHHQEFQLLLLL